MWQGVQQRYNGCIKGYNIGTVGVARSTTEVQWVHQEEQYRYSECGKGYNRGTVGVVRGKTKVQWVW